MHKLFSYVSLVTVFATSACTTIDGAGKAEIQSSAKSDDAWYPALKKWTREAHVYESFQKKADATAVLLVDEVRQAYSTRWQKLFGTGSGRLEGLKSSQLGVFVAHFSPNNNEAALDDTSLWSFGLALGDERRAAEFVSISTLPRKEIFEPFFPFITRWSNEYLLIFDTKGQAAPGTDEKFVVPSTVSLSLRSPAVAMEFRWP